jgi:predicted protein tyrosine phosphatase
VWQTINALFVCARNKLRSPTAEAVFFGTSGIEVRSAGTARDAENPISRDDLEWAETIFVMEKRHAKALKTMFGKWLDLKRIINLRIPDDFEFMDAKLIEILQAKVTPYLEPHVLRNTNDTSHHPNARD